MKEKIAAGQLKDCADQCTLRHYFVPKNKKFNCVVYGRQIFLPAGSLVVGKLHRENCLNLIMTGKVRVSSEFGKEEFEAPCVFVSPPASKRAVFAIHDTIWVTVHLTEHSGEENLDKIESEVISPSYKELGLVSSTVEDKT